MNIHERQRGGRPRNRSVRDIEEMARVHQKALAIASRYSVRQEDIEVPDAPNETQEKIREKLSKMYKRWRTGRTVDLEKTDPYERGDQYLFNAHLENDYFKDFYAEAEAEAIYRDESPTGDREFRGGLFASLATAYLKATEFFDHMVLDSSETLAITKVLHPNAQEMANSYGAIGLNGFYVPDGLKVGKIDDRIKITGIYEMSLSQKLEKYVDQLDGFYMFKRDLGPVATPAKFVIVVDRGNPVSFPAEAEKDVEILRLPFFMDEFNDFAYDVEHTYRRSGDHATLAELRIWRKEEARKIREKGEPAFFRGENPVMITAAGYKRVLHDPD